MEIVTKMPLRFRMAAARHGTSVVIQYRLTRDGAKQDWQNVWHADIQDRTYWGYTDATPEFRLHPKCDPELEYGPVGQGLRRYARYDDRECLADEHFMYWALTYLEAETGVHLDGRDFTPDDEVQFCQLMAEFFADMGM